MRSHRLAALPIAALLTLSGCASMQATDHSAHTSSAASASAAKPGGHAMDGKMKMMMDMHQKMAAAKTPEEKRALMAEHMKNMCQ